MQFRHAAVEGWNEAEVRGKAVMGAFTAINTSAAEPKPTQSTSETQDAWPTDQQQSIVAAYLGRGDTESSVPTAKAKKTGGGNGRKRANSAAKASKAKRRKSSNVSEGMPITKTKAKRDFDDALHDANAESKAQSNGDPETGSNATHQFTEGAVDILQPITVFTQPTSMTSIQSVQQAGVTTSLDAVRASKDYGQTVYDGRQSSAPDDDAVQVAQAWLNKATNDGVSVRRPIKKRPKSSRVQGQLAKATHDKEVSPHAYSGAPQEVSFHKLQLPTPVPSSDASTQATRSRKHHKRQAKKAPQIQTDEECFLISDESDEADLICAADEAEETARNNSTPPSRKLKENVRAVDADDDYGGALFSVAEQELLHKLELARTQQTGPKPIVRKPFPDTMLDRSPIFGASNITTLRTCFRIGEALNVGCQAVRMNRNVLLELYARVKQSHREEKPRRMQHFLFQDLYHDKPPHVTGTFDLWDQSKLWELDSRAFLSADQKKVGVMCRAIARMRRDGVKWRLEVLGIWQASWEDVETIAGIYSRPGEEPWLNADKVE